MSTATTSTRATPPAPQTQTTRVWIVCHPGIAPQPRGHDLPELITPGAWGAAEQLNGLQSFWTLRDRGHDGPAIAWSCGHRLRAHVDPVAGLCVEWTPDMGTARDRTVVAEIEDGRRAVSVGFRRLSIRQERRAGRLVTIVSRAALVHVALLPWNQTPAYRQASAWVVRGGDSPDELRRQRADAIGRAMALPAW